MAAEHFGGTLAGRFVLTAGLGGMGGAQPLAGALAGAAILCVEVDPARIDRRLRETGYLDSETRATSTRPSAGPRRPASAARRCPIGLVGNAAEVYPAILARGVVPDIVTDQTSAHDLVYGYVPAGMTLDQARRMLREREPESADGRRARRRSSTTCAAMLGFQAAGAEVLRQRQPDPHPGDGRAASPTPSTSRSSPKRYLRPLFCRGIGPFRWMALSGDARATSRGSTTSSWSSFPDNRIVTNWIRLARRHVPFEGLPARIAWLGHGERTRARPRGQPHGAARATCRGPVAFTRDHLDAGAMAHP